MHQITNGAPTTWRPSTSSRGHGGGFARPHDTGGHEGGHGTLLRWDSGGVLKLGSGDAAAIADVIAGLPGLRVRGIDIRAVSVARARTNTADRGVADRYTVEHGDFFDLAGLGRPGVARTVVSNPPYLPAPDGDLLMPELWGGPNGTTLVL